MKRHHLFAFYATFLIPAGALAGVAVGKGTGAVLPAVVIGVIGGLAAAGLALRLSPPGESS